MCQYLRDEVGYASVSPHQKLNAEYVQQGHFSSQEGVWLCPLQQCQEGEDVCFCLLLLFQLTKQQILPIEGARLRMCSVQERWASPREMSFLLGS